MKRNSRWLKLASSISHQGYIRRRWQRLKNRFGKTSAGIVVVEATQQVHGPANKLPGKPKCARDATMKNIINKEGKALPKCVNWKKE
jgi:hypothetical protein